MCVSLCPICVSFASPLATTCAVVDREKRGAPRRANVVRVSALSCAVLPPSLPLVSVRASTSNTRTLCVSFASHPCSTLQHPCSTLAAPLKDGGQHAAVHAQRSSIDVVVPVRPFGVCESGEADTSGVQTLPLSPSACSPALSLRLCVQDMDVLCTPSSSETQHRTAVGHGCWPHFSRWPTATASPLLLATAAAYPILLDRCGCVPH